MPLLIIGLLSSSYFEPVILLPIVALDMLVILLCGLLMFCAFTAFRPIIAESVEWLPVNDQKDLAFDHNKILKDYQQWRKTKATYWSSKTQMLGNR